MVDELKHHSARALLMNDSCTSSPARSLYDVCAWFGPSWPGGVQCGGQPAALQTMRDERGSGLGSELLGLVGLEIQA